MTDLDETRADKLREDLDQTWTIYWRSFHRTRGIAIDDRVKENLRDVTARSPCRHQHQGRWPRDWPPVFGVWRIGRYGKCGSARGWHQLLRRLKTKVERLQPSADGKFLATSILRLPPRSLASLCITISSAFLIAFLSLPLPRRTPTPPAFGIPRRKKRVALVIRHPAGGQRTRDPRRCVLSTKSPSCFHPGRRRILGSMWVLLWFALTLPMMQDPLLCSGSWTRGWM
ncbi:hypothetical protein C8F01DRAFT_1249088 [Mycena amicta]|nr:hypothetical protein C8F01DRAFT_1249088 [Mycena amicta]